LIEHHGNAPMVNLENTKRFDQFGERSNGKENARRTVRRARAKEVKYDKQHTATNQ
jgi:hypothetical protein